MADLGARFDNAETKSGKKGGGTGTGTGPNGPSPDSSPKGNRILTGDKFREEYKAVVYAIDGLLEAGRLLCLTGRTGHGKTTIALDVLAHIANGKTYQEREVVKGHVAFIAAENQIGTQHSYITMVENWPGFDESRFHFFVVEHIKPIEDLRGQLHQYAVERGIKFSALAIDSASVLFPYDNFNDPGQQRDFAAELARFKTLPGNPGGFVLCHPNARANSIATMWPVGASMFVTQLDGNWALWRNGDIVEVGYTKLRIAEWQPFKLKIGSATARHTKDAKGRPLTGSSVRVISRDEAVAQERQDRDARKRILQAIYAADSPEHFTSARLIGIAAGLCMPATHKDHRTVQTVRRNIAGLKADKLIEWPNKHAMLSKKGRDYCVAIFGPR
jgi:hypothetical protein